MLLAVGVVFPVALGGCRSTGRVANRAGHPHSAQPHPPEADSTRTSAAPQGPTVGPPDQARPVAQPLVDIDLTRGDEALHASGRSIDRRGGVFKPGKADTPSEGWQQTVGTDRLTLDLGRPVKRGTVELTVFVAGNPIEGPMMATAKKNVFFGIWETVGDSSIQTSHPTFNHYGGGAKGYLRVRTEKPRRNYFLEIKSYEAAFDKKEGDARLGTHADWAPLVGREVTFQISWGVEMTQNGPAPIFRYDGPLGPVTRSGPQGVAQARYVTVGSEDLYRAHIPAFIYRRIRVFEDL